MILKWRMAELSQEILLLSAQSSEGERTACRVDPRGSWSYTIVAREASEGDDSQRYHRGFWGLPWPNNCVLRGPCLGHGHWRQLLPEVEQTIRACWPRHRGKPFLVFRRFTLRMVLQLRGRRFNTPCRTHPCSLVKWNIVFGGWPGLCALMGACIHRRRDWLPTFELRLPVWNQRSRKSSQLTVWLYNAWLTCVRSTGRS